MMESVVEGQEKVDEILKEREADLVNARKEKEELRIGLDHARADAAQSEKAVLSLQKDLRLVSN